MKLMKEPDEVREHYPVACAGCPNKGICPANVAERRYESEIVVESRLIEHRQIVCCCQMANNVAITGEFPQNITGTKQYGNNLKAFAVALSTDGFEANPVPAKLKWKRGRPGKGKILSLLERLWEYKADILRFATDWSVPFTNNEAERTIRFSKVKQKVSGCFRTVEGAEEYASIMSYISTAREQGMAYFESVKQAMSGNALALLEQWV